MEKETEIIEYGEEASLEGYADILEDIRSLLQKAQYQAYKAIDNLRVQTYWQIGERITREVLIHGERADYGTRLVGNLAIDLGFSRRLMYEIVKFYEIYPIVQTVSAQLSWSHYTTLIRIDSKQERGFYEIQTAQNRWSVRGLRKEIKGGAFHFSRIYSNGITLQTINSTLICNYIII